MKTILTLLILSLLLLSQNLFSQVIVKANKTQAIVDLGKGTGAPGQQYFVYSANGTKVGIIQLIKVQKSKASAKIVKGKAEKGMTIKVAAAAPTTTQAQVVPPTPAPVEQSDPLKKGAPRTTDPLSEDFSQTRRSDEPKPKIQAGLMLGYSMNTMKVKSTSGAVSQDLNLTGSTLSYKAFVDYPPNTDFNLRLLVGMEPYEVKGTPESGGAALCNGECEVKFDYISMEGHGQYNIVSGPTRFWIGLGYAFLMAGTSSSTIAGFDTEVKTNQILSFSLGVDVKIGKTMVLPLAFEYGMYPTSGDLSANGMFARFGLGKQF